MLIERAIAPLVIEAMASARVVALLGARQVGKSTLARQLAEETLGALYLTLDDEPVRKLATADPSGFVAGLKPPVVIDEVQRAPEVLLAIKARVDRDPAPGTFLLTGSANLRRIPAVADALPGRVDYLTLWPFTQGEIEGHRERFLDRAFAGEIPAIDGAPVGRSAYAERIVAGGFPEAHTRTPGARTRFFNSYIDSIVARDVADAARLHDPNAVGTLLRLVAARSSGLARYQSLAGDLSHDGKTVKAYLDVLERLFLIRIRQPWHVNLGKRQVKAPKLYISDAGLLSGLIGADTARVIEDGGFAGSIFETFVATELERQSSWMEPAPTFWHYRDGDHEVDVIAERASGEIVGFEVKASASVRPRDFAGLRRLRAAVGDRLVAGMVLYLGGQSLPFGDGLWAVPLEALWRR